MSVLHLQRRGAETCAKTYAETVVAETSRVTDDITGRDLGVKEQLIKLSMSTQTQMQDSLPYKNIEELAMHLNEVDPLSEGARSFLGQKARYLGEVIAILVGRCCVLRPH